MAGPVRTVVENVSVTEVIDDNQSTYPRLVDAYEGLKWLLARNPEIGEIFDDVNWLYVQAGDPGVKVPSLVVIYTFDAQTVTLRHIKVY